MRHLVNTQLVVVTCWAGGTVQGAVWYTVLGSMQVGGGAAPH